MTCFALRLATLPALLTAYLALPALAAPTPAPGGPDFAGTATLEVDLRDVSHKVFHIHEVLPVTAGAQTLLLPKWIQGTHAPWGAIASVAGLHFSAQGKEIPWQRDTLEMHAFHVDVPANVKELDIRFDYLTPVGGEKNWDGLLSSGRMVDLEWNTAILYPRGVDYRRMRIAPSVTLPAQWHYACALDGARANGSRIDFAETSLETLLDSPLYGGAYEKVIDLTPAGSTAPVHLNIFAETPAYLDTSAESITAYRKLVSEAYSLYGAHHYDHYDFLLSLSDTFGGKGLEHHRSTETGLPLAAFTDYEHQWVDRDLLPHEYTHSWNGKFRRPEDTWRADLETPMRNTLLWVYEGQTQYWGKVLAARSGLLSVDQSHESWAALAAELDEMQGRSWRALQDTTTDEIVNARAGRDWPSYQRDLDYYNEGALIWLDADTLIRERSAGKRSLDDFAKRFLGHADGVFAPEIYSFEEVVQELNAVEPYDWASFLRTRLDRTGLGAPLDGLKRSGWTLTYTDKPNEALTAIDTNRKTTGFQYSIGLVVDKDDNLSDVEWGSAAYKAGLAPGVKVLAVNGLKYSSDRLKDAIKAAQADPAARIVLDVLSDEHISQASIDYHGGNRYPHLEKIKGAENRLDAIFAAHSKP